MQLSKYLCIYILMETNDFFQKIQNTPNPVVVDLWAPWCGPCKVVKPILEKLSKEYGGRVDLWQINADESHELLQKLGVYGIPTLIVYRNGAEVMRYIGVKPAKAYQSIFETLSTGGVPGPAALGLVDRLLRAGLGLVVAWLAWKFNSNMLLFALSGVFLFSAVYDRCPIWRAITLKFKELTSKA
jgi:thioredoxin 1